VSYRRNDDRFLIFVENHTPITNSKPIPVASLEALHIAMPGIGKLR